MSPTPRVPLATDTIGRGPSPRQGVVGTSTRPVTGMSWPVAFVEWYITR
ncbi:hypothetical protein [Promicromonospora sp. NPDC050262]